MPRYYVETKTARSRPYIAACVVRVLDAASGPSNWHHVRRGCVRQWGAIYMREGHCLDRRYRGPRSSYGQALAAAEAMAARLNAEGNETEEN